MKKALIIGSGAGGAMAAKMLVPDFDVTVLEAGGAFHPLALPLNALSALRPTGLYFDERLISVIMPNMRIAKTPDQVVVYGRGLGGTTTLATGNAVRADRGLKAIGINLDEEFEALAAELPITTDHQRHWSKLTRQTFATMQELGYDPQPMPKFLRPSECRLCGHCSIGCPHGAKWDTRELLDGIRVITNCRVERLDIGDGRVRRVVARHGLRTVTFEADVIVLAAGGIGTPQILSASGITCEQRLFVDPVLCVAASLPSSRGDRGGLGARQDRQLLMPFVSQRDGYILSPYIDWLSYFFNRKWRKPMDNIVSLMIKMADEEQGTVEGSFGRSTKVRKTLTARDQDILKHGIEDCTEILLRMGIRREDIFLGTLNSGHPGGMLPLTAAEADTLHSPLLPDNLYVADASLLPESLGLPPILTIMALARRIAKTIKANCE